MLHNNIKSDQQEKDPKGIVDEGITPCGDKLWKTPEDDNISPEEVFECPMIPGTAGIET